MDKRKTALLLPTAYRPDNLKRCLDSLFDSGSIPDRIIVSPFKDDLDSLGVAYVLPVQTRPRPKEFYSLGSVFGWNYCYSYTQGCDCVVLGADDQVYHPGWMEDALYELGLLGEPGLVAFNDGSSNGKEYAAHWLAHKLFLDKYVGDCMYPPIYKSWWCDRELSDIAQLHNCYAYAEDARVDHLHYSFGRSRIDPTYQAAMNNYDGDERLYRERKSQGFPVTWERTVYRG